MSAQRLRDAARLMRARAGAATPGPWTWDEETDEPFPQGANALRGAGGSPVIDSTGYDAWGVVVKDGDAAHIASWHPAVALAVADWLDYEAERVILHMDPRALAVANAYLGDPS